MGSRAPLQPGLWGRPVVDELFHSGWAIPQGTDYSQWPNFRSGRILVAISGNTHNVKRITSNLPHAVEEKRYQN